MLSYIDIKGSILFVSAIILQNVNQILTTTGLILNVAYIGYQIYTHRKNNDKQG